MAETEISRTEKSITYATGKTVAKGLREFRTEFHSGTIFLPDLVTRVDTGFSKLSGLDTVFDRLAAGAKITFDGKAAAYTVEKNGAAMRYECMDGCDLVGVDGSTVTYRRKSDGLPIVFNLSRTMAKHYSDFDPGVTQEPTFKRIADQKGIDTFAFLRPRVYDPAVTDMLKILLSGDITHNQDGTILTGFDFSKLKAGKIVRVDPTTSITAASGDGRVLKADTPNTDWATVRDATTGSAVENGNTTMFAANNQIAGGNYSIRRCFFGFDISTITAGSAISAATFKVYKTANDNRGMTGNAIGIALIESSQDSMTTLVETDFNNVTFTAWATTDTTAWPTSAYKELAINATGFSRLEALAGGNAKMALIGRLDLTNVAPDGNEAEGEFETSEGTNDPTLDLTYTVPTGFANLMLLGVG